jgi:hypothetical protein
MGRRAELLEASHNISDKILIPAWRPLWLSHRISVVKMTFRLGAIMFRWFKRKQLREQKKLLLQNGSAARAGLKVYSEHNEDMRTVARLAKIEETNDGLPCLLMKLNWLLRPI